MGGREGGRVGSAKRGEDEHHSITNTPLLLCKEIRKPHADLPSFFFVLRAKPKFPKISSFWGNKSPFLLARSNAPFPRQDVLGFGLLRFAPSASPAPV